MSKTVCKKVRASYLTLEIYGESFEIYLCEKAFRKHSIYQNQFTFVLLFSSNSSFEMHVNMVLRMQTEISSPTIQTSSLSYFVGLPEFCHDAIANPAMDCDKWRDLFQYFAKYISRKIFHFNHGVDRGSKSAESQGSYIVGGS